LPQYAADDALDYREQDSDFDDSGADRAFLDAALVDDDEDEFEDVGPLPPEVPIPVVRAEVKNQAGNVVEKAVAQLVPAQFDDVTEVHAQRAFEEGKTITPLRAMTEYFGKRSRSPGNPSGCFSVVNGTTVFFKPNSTTAKAMGKLVQALADVGAFYAPPDAAGTSNTFVRLERYRKADTFILGLEASLQKSYADVNYLVNDIPQWAPRSPRLGVRRGKYQRGVVDPSTGNTLTKSQQENNTTLFFPELWMTLYAARVGCTPNIYAALMTSDWPTYIVEQGVGLEKFVAEYEREQMLRASENFHKAMEIASKAGILMTDIKALNMVVMDALSPAPRPLFIDFDDVHASVIDIPKENSSHQWQCIYVMNAMMLTLNLLCSSPSERENAIALLSVIRQKGKEYVARNTFEASAFCFALTHEDVIGGSKQPIRPPDDEAYYSDFVYLYDARTWEAFAQKMLQNLRHYTNFDRKYPRNDTPGRARRSCPIFLNRNAAIFPQLVTIAFGGD
jgi:hypothetical protein